MQCHVITLDTTGTTYLSYEIEKRKGIPHNLDIYSLCLVMNKVANTVLLGYRDRHTDHQEEKKKTKKKKCRAPPSGMCVYSRPQTVLSTRRRHPAQP